MKQKQLYGPKRAYDQQRSHARQRGIVWQFTFEEWVAWWLKSLGPDWFSRRGKHKGQFCMARCGDVGPYSLKNVKCVTMEANSAETRRRRGSDHWAARLKEKEVISILKEKDINDRQIAEKYQISKRLVRAIKAGVRWSHLPRP